MCRTYTITFTKHPCTHRCSSELTERIRPCQHAGTPQCIRQPGQALELPYRCAFHLQKTVFPAVRNFLRTVLTHHAPTYGRKYSALHPTVGPHLRQWGYCAWLAVQDEYYEAARTQMYRLLHRGQLPGGDGAPPPRMHWEILMGFRERLGEALRVYRDDAMLMVWTTKELQPEGARFLFEYPILPQAQFEQEFKDAREGRMCHYPLADVFDGLEWEDESEEPETDAGTNGGDVEAGAPGHSGSGQREGVSSQRSQG